MNAPTAAATAYNQSAARIQALLEQLQQSLKVHVEKTGQRPRDWGFVGDLHNIENRLRELTENFHP